LVAKKKLDNINPQSYGIGIKELWDVQPGRIQPGYVAHTLGWPVPSSMYGGGWIYGLSNNRVSIGLVIALEYADPRFDPQRRFSNGKQIRLSRNFWMRKARALRRKVVAVRRLVRDAAELFRWRVDIGDSASFLDSQNSKAFTSRSRAACLPRKQRSKHSKPAIRRQRR